MKQHYFVKLQSCGGHDDLPKWIKGPSLINKFVTIFFIHSFIYFFIAKKVKGDQSLASDHYNIYVHFINKTMIEIKIFFWFSFLLLWR